MLFVQVVLQYLEFFNVAGAVSRDELFGRLYAGLDKINFFTSSPGGPEDPNQIAKATQLFDEAWMVCVFHAILCIDVKFINMQIDIFLKHIHGSISFA